ncbi:hypothetical protein COV11_01845 [Candidatus Woesearchaeota archaeon CG10_big_fil_rev_8_21_14_0_10_30_7]|nr:MAG: hypothetical protein COV11_01845 [Candidatus Woesearchaeota archaeon CG10_big_fil_rev_8_21_14_0_10_30_7]
MATILDFGLLKPFEAIFPFLFLMVFLYAVLTRFETFKDKPAFSAIIAFVLSIMSMMSPILVRTISLMAPWFVLLIIFMVMLLLAYQAFGIKEGTIIDLVKSDSYGETFTWTIIIVVGLIFVGSLTTAFSEQQGFQQLQKGELAPVPSDFVEPGSEKEDFFKTVFHPKVLGLIVLMLLALVTVQRLTAES